MLASFLIILLYTLLLEFSGGSKNFIWLPRYLPEGKQPYDLNVLNEQMPNIFPGKEIARLSTDDLSSYYVSKYEYQDVPVLHEVDPSFQQKFNFVAISQYFSMNYQDAKSLLLHVYHGNEALIASYDDESEITRMLGLEISSQFLDTATTSASAHYQICMAGDTSQMKPYGIFARIVNFPDSAEVLATNSLNHVVAVKVRVGAGYITYFTLPITFTNYYLLKVKPKVSETLLLNLPNENTRWGSWFMGRRKSPGLLSFIHSRPSLKWGFYTLLFSLLIFFAFQVKRKERPVPIINPPENISLKFAETLSRLYLLRGDHGDMAQKKMTYLLEFIRKKYNLSTHQIDPVFMERLANKSNVGLANIQELFTLYDQLKNRASIVEADFLRFNRLIQNFKKHRT